jgi:predicted transcriptional regulator
MQSQLKPMGIKLAITERERLKKLGEQKKRSSHWLAKEAISQYLDREEAAERFKKETIERWEEYKTTGKSVSNDDVMAWLDSWGAENEPKAPT